MGKEWTNCRCCRCYFCCLSSLAMPRTLPLSSSSLPTSILLIGWDNNEKHQVWDQRHACTNSLSEPISQQASQWTLVRWCIVTGCPSLMMAAVAPSIVRKILIDASGGGARANTTSAPRPRTAAAHHNNRKKTSIRAKINVAVVVDRATVVWFYSLLSQTVVNDSHYNTS